MRRDARDKIGGAPFVHERQIGDEASGAVVEDHEQHDQDEADEGRRRALVDQLGPERRAVVELRTSPWFTPELFHPTGVTLLGYFLGQVSVIGKNLAVVAVLVVLLSVAPLAWELRRGRRT